MIGNTSKWSRTGLLAASILAVLPLLQAGAAERVGQIHERGTRTRALVEDPARSILTAGASSRVCESGAKWLRLDFRSLKLRGYDSLVLRSSGGDRQIFQGAQWNNRSFTTRALRGSCVDIQPYFADRDSAYRLSSVTSGMRALSETSVVVAGAGDLCDSTPADCKATSDLIVNINPEMVFTAGDNAYNDGTLSEYNTRYAPNWGRFKDKTRPTPGNHDYYSTGNWGTGYFDYFNGVGQQAGVAGDRNKGYYSWDVGDWRFVALNTMDGATISSTSEQVTWLKQTLAANPKPCTAAYFHHPLISLGNYTPDAGQKYSYPEVKALYDALYEHQADLVLVGHDHNYQRYIKMNPNLEADPKGFVQVLVGTGGRDFYPVPTANRTNPLLALRPGSTTDRAVSASTYGVLKLTLSSTGYTGEFVRATHAGNGDLGSTSRPENFSGTCNKANTGTTYAISGAVTTSTGAAIPNVRISNGSATVTTNASGQYSFTGLSNGPYTLTPSLSGYTFSPISQSVAINGANVSGRNFTGTAVAAGVLSNGVPVTGLSGAQGTELRYTLQVPAGATNLRFVTSGGSGDADLYVRFGSAPTTSDPLKSESSTNAETITIATAQAGTYHVLVRGYSAFSGASLTGSFTTGSAGVQTYSNNTAVAIPDGSATGIESRIAVSGRTGNAPSTAQVRVNITHAWRGDVRVTLVAPDGTSYPLKAENSSDSADNIYQTYQVNLSAEALNGTWTLRVADLWTPDAGRLDNWSITF
ncbi:proprotein convertase P-domain-containing protein [Lysobacter brunescens]|uniref:Proprotein convertase P-domain-containing protein n=1 Tax=Lysobacter brunescens TaxID=262323 RepID=A0ABW2YBP5_9GAMM